LQAVVVHLARHVIERVAQEMHGVEFVVADDHAGLRAALREVLAEAAYQRCYVLIADFACFFLEKWLILREGVAANVLFRSCRISVHRLWKVWLPSRNALTQYSRIAG